MRLHDRPAGRLPFRTHGSEKFRCHRGLLVTAHSIRDELSRIGLHGEDCTNDSGAIVADNVISHVHLQRITLRAEASPRAFTAR
jgi:hypothetical protein